MMLARQSAVNSARFLRCRKNYDVVIPVTFVIPAKAGISLCKLRLSKNVSESNKIRESNNVRNSLTMLASVA
jgi:hypothetical protein